MFTPSQLNLINTILYRGTIDLAGLKDICNRVNINVEIITEDCISFSATSPHTGTTSFIHVSQLLNFFTIEVINTNIIIVITSINKILTGLDSKEVVRIINGDIVISDRSERTLLDVYSCKYSTDHKFRLFTGLDYMSNKVNVKYICTSCKYFANSSYVYCAASPYGYLKPECTYVSA